MKCLIFVALIQGEENR